MKQPHANYLNKSVKTFGKTVLTLYILLQNGAAINLKQVCETFNNNNNAKLKLCSLLGLAWPFYRPWHQVWHYRHCSSFIDVPDSCHSNEKKYTTSLRAGSLKLGPILRGHDRVSMSVWITSIKILTRLFRVFENWETE